ncbi:putative membrane protein [Ehrlichia ruminantium]|uniref:hypothetical protein n=1 Tax=Ehrlichia ruminantium TaxID=779 RepID=UPI0007C10378|nr:hypothetical protein [Ehrlichia ruminantium]QLK52387.1 hypothetical protein FDZ65_02605 [Ehrlichia ruminantium]QLK54217.1 hypothetical protein FDZ63_02600 [Ehrlichia ruminantium]QLK56969.1 hypothetical protein FDZ60_02610 [Ehrlichia ruminantium]GAT76299.1 putative membrane protein [Ehrlichia ruminantium]
MNNHKILQHSLLALFTLLIILLIIAIALYIQQVKIQDSEKNEINEMFKKADHIRGMNQQIIKELEIYRETNAKLLTVCNKLRDAAQETLHDAIISHQNLNNIPSHHIDEPSLHDNITHDKKLHS